MGDTSTTMLGWALSPAFQGIWGRRVTSPQHSISISRVLLFPSHTSHNRLQTPRRALPPTHRKSCVANASDSLWFDFILHKSPFHLGRRNKEVGNPTVSLGNRPSGSRGGSNLHNAIKQTNEKRFCNRGEVQISSMSMGKVTGL